MHALQIDCSPLMAGLAVNAGRVYWTEGQYPRTDTIGRADVDGTDETVSPPASATLVK